MEEVWKPCFRYEVIYIVSNLGQVARVQLDGSLSMMKSSRVDAHGYNMVNLKDRGRSNSCRVCKLVAMAHLNCGEKDYIHHLDWNLANNSTGNLVFAANKELLPRDITHEILLREILYVPETGEFFRRPTEATKSDKRREMRKTGCEKCYNGKMYVQISIMGIQFLGHRLAYFYMVGRLPDDEVDHIDGNGLNNRWDNLRAATRVENCRNVRYRREGGNDDVGIHYCKRRKHWIASAGKQRKCCRTKEQALIERDRFRKENGFHENHGKEKSP